MSQMDLGNGHTPAEVWQEIKHFLAQHPGVYRTRLQNKGMGVRFGAELTADGRVQVTLQKGQCYTLPDKNFSALYPLYFVVSKGKPLQLRPWQKAVIVFIFGASSTGAIYGVKCLPLKVASRPSRRSAEILG